MAQSEFRRPKAEDCLSDCHTCSQMAIEYVNSNHHMPTSIEQVFSSPILSWEHKKLNYRPL
jgi:hypothetical protein